jgi:hypothetical protein
MLKYFITFYIQIAFFFNKNVEFIAGSQEYKLQLDCYSLFVHNNTIIWDHCFYAISPILL